MVVRVEQLEARGQRGTDRVEGNKVILNGQGAFPKRLIIVEPGKVQEYRIVQTQSGKYQLTK